MTTEEVTREDEYSAANVTYADAIERTVDALNERYDVKRVTNVSAHYDESNTEWWTRVTAEVQTDG